MSSPDLSTEVIGFRQWYVTEDLQLRAAHKRSQVWTPGVNAAECHPDDLFRPPCPESPGHDCACGIYALHAPGDLWYGKGHDNWLSTPETDTLVSGVIVAWGNIEVHHQGFRAQHARVVALATPAGKRDAVVARAAAGEYGVPCVPVDELPRIASEFGEVVPESLRPEKPERTGFEMGVWAAQWFVGPQAVPVSNVWRHGFMPSSPAPSSYHYFGHAVRHGVLISDETHVHRHGKTGGQKKADRIARNLGRTKPGAPLYDPRMFTSKRNGGFR